MPLPASLNVYCVLKEIRISNQKSFHKDQCMDWSGRHRNHNLIDNIVGFPRMHYDLERQYDTSNIL